MSYLYREQPRGERAECEKHLQSCPKCQEDVARWRGGMALLDEDSASLMPALQSATAKPARSWQPVAARWAAAASIALAAGFAMGRMSGPSSAEIQKQLASVREDVTREVQARYQQDLQELARATVASTLDQQHQWFESLGQQLSLQQSQNNQFILRAVAGLRDDNESLRTTVFQLAQDTGRGFHEVASVVNELGSSEGAGTGTGGN